MYNPQRVFLVKTMVNEIIQRSCESMPEIASESVALTVTSPPYWNAIDYDIHAENQDQNYRTRSYSSNYLDYETYLDWLDVVFKEVHRVTKPGGFCSIVIGTILLDGKHYPVPFDLSSRLINSGWLFHQDIIWHKCTAGVKRAGVAIQKPFPGYYYPNIMSEYILVFRKPGPKIYQDRTSAEKTGAEFTIDTLFTLETANNIWHIAPVPPGTIDHPAPFPEEIPFRLISLYSYKGDLILDPFSGSGQTLKVAHALERGYFGYETLSKYIQLAEKRIGEPLSLRPKQLTAVFERITPGKKPGKLS
jgi:site-specific DNA-methyltransferase (adenine-specific)